MNIQTPVLPTGSHSALVRSVKPEFLLRTNNPDAEITSPYKGYPENFVHGLSEGIDRAIRVSNYQSIEHTWADIGKHQEFYLGEKLIMTARLDEFGNPGVITDPKFAIRHPDTIRSLLPSSGHPRFQKAEPCHLTDQDILEMFFSAHDQGMPWSWTIVKPKFGEIVGDYLVFCPSHMAIYFSAAIDKLGKCVNPARYGKHKPFNPKLIHVAMPWLTDQEFGGVHTILVGTGRKRQSVINGGVYDGGTKKPVTFNVHNRELPLNSNMITTHMAIGEMLNGRRIAIGNTTAAGKSEIVTDTVTFPRAHRLSIVRPNGKKFEIDLSLESALIRHDRLSRERRRMISDDISALVARLDGVYGAEIENSTFYRDDLAKGPGDLPFIDDCCNGKVPGRIYHYNMGMNPQRTRFQAWSPCTLDPEKTTSNNRTSFLVESNPDMIPSGPDEMQKIDALVVAIPVPKLENGFHLPPFVRVSTDDFFAHCLHGRRANKGNPALGALGGGAWAAEGYLGKMGFTLDSAAQCLTRDFKFWQALRKNTPCFLIFNEAHQEFKYSGTMLFRAIYENWYDELLSARIIRLPGTFCSGIPDLSFLPEGALDRELWDPTTYDQPSLESDCRALDSFVYYALNSLMSEAGLSEDTSMVISDMARKYIQGQRHEFRLPDGLEASGTIDGNGN